MVHLDLFARKREMSIHLELYWRKLLSVEVLIKRFASFSIPKVSCTEVSIKTTK